MQKGPKRERGKQPPHTHTKKKNRTLSFELFLCASDMTLNSKFWSGNDVICPDDYSCQGDHDAEFSYPGGV